MTPPRRTRGLAQKTLEQIASCTRILAEIQPASVRAVAYQLFILKLIDSMSRTNTARVSRQLVYAREHGIVPWEWIVDETRQAERVAQFDDPEEFAEVVQNSYRRDRWSQHPRRVEVWSEKSTVRGTLAPVLDQFGVTFRVMHGFGSSTAVHDVADETRDSENPLLVLYVGDWDPSGRHMSDMDLPARLDRYDGSVEIQRVALIEEDLGGLPSFDADTKAKDPRYKWFVRNYGHRCWELDALSPAVLRERVESRIRDVIDPEYWDRCEIVEQAEKESLVQVMAGWQSLLSGAAP